MLYTDQQYMNNQIQWFEELNSIIAQNLYNIV